MIELLSKYADKTLPFDWPVMKIAILAIGLFGASFLLHWLLWRMKVPQRQSAALLVILLGTLPLGLAAVLFVPGLSFFRPLGIGEIAHVTIFHVAVTLAYIVAYSALEGRSPSMALLLSVADSRGKGRSRQELESLLRSERPVELRLEAMLRDEMVTESDGVYCLTAKGWAWARSVGVARIVLKLKKGG